MNQEQLQELINKVGVANLEAAIKARKNKLTYMNVFKGIKIESKDIEKINRKHHIVTNPYVDFNRYRSPYSRKGQVGYIGFDYDGEALTHNSLGVRDLHVAIKVLTFALLGEKNGKRLDEDELKFARSAYVKLKELYLNLYDLRLTELE
ncbi:hypothetical protein [Pediococcus pentosaceus]|uniref:hypothetical protein n=1 Tax=Pediococcus pentosaceus TaxID=1255 RepID=UPI001C7CF6BB|nr:hypothetical protein [Pediococcus pentosaceus]QYY85646.1 hypothetical protein GRI00_03505 [Pediococcus pentosaceus]